MCHLLHVISNILICNILSATNDLSCVVLNLFQVIMANFSSSSILIKTRNFDQLMQQILIDTTHLKTFL